MRDPDEKRFPLPVEFDRGSTKDILYSLAERNALKAAALRALAMRLSDSDLVARAVVLHSDIATLGDGTGSTLHYADGARLDLEVHPDHWATARTLADALDRKAGRDEDLDFWYRASLAQMASMQLWNAPHAARALARFPADAALQFFAGCLHETLATNRVQSAVAGPGLPSTVVLRVDSADGELDQAASRFKRALTLNPRHDEARLHYGRVLTLAGKADVAVGELRRTVGVLTEPVQQYYAQLFLGAALESSNQRAEAEAAYQSAAALFPQAQAPRLALSQLSFSSGDRVAADEALAPLLQPRTGDAAGEDPWRTYVTSCGRGATADMDEARQRLATARGGAKR
jgi:tetratricopeptide (TPR) repeat protein